MSGTWVSQRFGWDAPARIQVTADYFAGADEMPIPGEDPIQALLPFPELAGIGLPAGPKVTTPTAWRQEPDRFDLYFPAGDDIAIPLRFYAANYPDFDFSVPDWTWHAQVRTGKGPGYPLVAEFDCTSEFTTAAPPDLPDSYLTVTMSLAREDNWRHGDFYWDLQGVGPAPVIEDDPTPGRAHTFLSGSCHVTREITTLPGEWPPERPPYSPVSGGWGVVITTGGTVGPNGQVP